MSEQDERLFEWLDGVPLEAASQDDFKWAYENIVPKELIEVAIALEEGKTPARDAEEHLARALGIFRQRLERLSDADKERVTRLVLPLLQQGGDEPLIVRALTDSANHLAAAALRDEAGRRLLGWMRNRARAAPAEAQGELAKLLGLAHAEWGGSVGKAMTAVRAVESMDAPRSVADLRDVLSAVQQLVDLRYQGYAYLLDDFHRVAAGKDRTSQRSLGVVMQRLSTLAASDSDLQALIRPDMGHIRNAIAHQRIKVDPEDLSTELTDLNSKGTETYRHRFAPEDVWALLRDVHYWVGAGGVVDRCLPAGAFLVWPDTLDEMVREWRADIEGGAVFSPPDDQ